MEGTGETFKQAYGDMPSETTGTQSKYGFGGPRPSLFMAFNRHRDSGHVNPAYQREDSDDVEGATSDGSDPECNSSSMDTEDNASNRMSNVSSVERQTIDTDNLTNGKVPNGRGEFKVGFETIEPHSTAPPVQRHQSKKKKEKRPWDRFITESTNNFTEENNKFWERVFIVTKIVVIIVLFVLILGTAVINKICFFIITANMFPPDGNDIALQLLKTANKTLTYKADTNSTQVMWIWALVMTIGAPYFFTLCRSVWKLAFMMANRNSPAFTTLMSVLAVETIHSVGLNLMVFVVIPNMDPVSGVLFCLCIVMVPGVLNTVFPLERITEIVTEKENGASGCRRPGLSRACSRAIGFFGALGQIAALGLWTFHLYLTFNKKFDNIGYMICAIAAPIFTSFYWWENYVAQGNRDSTGLPKLARDIRRCRTKLAFFSSVWKLCITIVIPIGVYGFNCNDGKLCVDTLFFKHEYALLDSGFGSTKLDSITSFGSCNGHLPFIVASIGVLCSGVCFKLCKVACKIMTQIVDMTVPLLLSTPVAIGVVLGMYTGFITTDKTGCALPFPLWNESENLESYFTALSNGYELWIPILAGLAGFGSFILVTIHAWMPGKERLQTTDRLFVLPLYCGIFSDLSLLLNRRRMEKVGIKDSVKHHRRNVLSNLPLPEGGDEAEKDMLAEDVYRTQDTPFIYMCATMWHETEVEMTQLLKSIFRMDEDQCTRKHTQFLVNRRDPDYYEFEAHIFFDDAFEKHRTDQFDFTVNSYVKLLIKNMKVSASSIYGVTFKLPDPVKVPTPYGGRLIWTMPGGNKLIAHLKDKNLIRHRKRWSQVMYMYYFLAYELFKKYSGKVLRKRAANTFLLALDGDVDFQPAAVQLLVDRMRKNLDVGAACGRIHPIGNGAMVWYQKFEYAVSHWLQKAAEDKLGCVLCSPGCFSLFRGSALMDDNVMNKYTTPPTEPRHHVQYDQGEDRWLCTLMLQQGHRVEYCAASDALTYAPEGFYEFFNQRRRWTPSTMANIMDLLTDWKNVTKKNPEISLVYIFYQGLLMVSSILTPGTIFLMVLGAINMAYPDIDLWMALLFNAIPIAILVLLCFCAKSDTQLLYSAILSTFYSLVMMVVIVGLLRQAANYGACSITTMFLIFVAGVFVLAAFIHPQEFWCIIHGFLYFLAIPSMSMVLMIYSLGNLNNVSWGTRDTKTAAEKKDESETEKKLRGAVGFFTRCFGDRPQNKTQLDDANLRRLLERLDGIEYSIAQMSEVGSSRASLLPRTGSPFSHISRSRSPIVMGEDAISVKFSQISEALEGGGGKKENPIFDDAQVARDPMVNPYWLEEDTDMMNFKRNEIPGEEAEFWSELIEEYLQPIESNPEREKQMQEELTELRNKVCLIFILINSLFIIIVFSLQQVVSSGDSLAIKLWCVDDDQELSAGQRIEPISVAFTVVFGILLFVQFVCMLMHRLATLLHICAATELFKKKRKIDIAGQKDEEAGGTDESHLTYEAVYAMVRDMQKVQDPETASIASESSYAPSEVDEEEDAETRRKEVKNRWKKIAKRRNRFQGNTLGANFRKNFIRLQEAIKTDEQDGVEEKIDIERRAHSLYKRTHFNGFTRKSMHTLAHLTQNKQTKDVISGRELRAKSRWRSAIETTRLQNVRENKATGGNGVMSRIVKAAIAHKESRQSQEDVLEGLYEAVGPGSSIDNGIPGSTVNARGSQGSTIAMLHSPSDASFHFEVDQDIDDPTYAKVRQTMTTRREGTSENATTSSVKGTKDKQTSKFLSIYENANEGDANSISGRTSVNDKVIETDDKRDSSSSTSKAIDGVLPTYGNVVSQSDVNGEDNGDVDAEAAMVGKKDIQADDKKDPGPRAMVIDYDLPSYGDAVSQDGGIGGGDVDGDDSDTGFVTPSNDKNNGSDDNADDLRQTESKPIATNGDLPTYGKSSVQDVGDGRASELNDYSLAYENVTRDSGATYTNDTQDNTYVDTKL